MEIIKFRKFLLKTEFLLAQTEGKISENDICFILDSKEIYTNGVFFGTPYIP